MFVKILKHFKTIIKHKFWVMKLCFKCKLYKRGLLHDLSKFSPVEFFNSAKYYKGYKSPIEAEKQAKGYSLAWLHHKGRNPHHWEYWLDGANAIKIPYEYAVEMVCDWAAANMVYTGAHPNNTEPFYSPFGWCVKNINNMKIHKDTKRLAENLLWHMANEGINGFAKSAIQAKDKYEKSK